jgi:hypothetical protein
MTKHTLHLGDCLDVLRTLPDNSVDAVVTDPPYGLSFMGKRWDYDVPAVDVWTECLRVLKPGGHLLAFAGTRTQHRMAVRIEDAGFEIRDMIAWIYGSGFPKSLDVSKAIDNAAGAVREVVGVHVQSRQDRKPGNSLEGSKDASLAWQHDITVARKPLSGTVAETVTTWGTGAINVDGCRVGTSKSVPSSPSTGGQWYGDGGENGTESGHNPNIGRFPANLIHDGSDEVVGLFPETTTGKPTVGSQPTTGEVFGAYAQRSTVGGGDSGSAARFFYCAKASKADRDDGCDALPFRESAEMVDRDEDSPGIQSPRAGAGRKNGARNFHPTVKPTDLMRYLCRLVTPPGGTVLDPFMGSGSTGRGALEEGFRFIGIERDPEYFKIAEVRIPPRQPRLF